MTLRPSHTTYTNKCFPASSPNSNSSLAFPFLEEEEKKRFDEVVGRKKKDKHSTPKIKNLPAPLPAFKISKMSFPGKEIIGKHLSIQH